MKNKEFLEIFSNFLILRKILQKYCKLISRIEINKLPDLGYKDYLKYKIEEYIDYFLVLFPNNKELIFLKENLNNHKLICSQKLELWFLQEDIGFYFKINKNLFEYYFIQVILNVILDYKLYIALAILYSTFLYIYFQDYYGLHISDFTLILKSFISKNILIDIFYILAPLIILNAIILCVGTFLFFTFKIILKDIREIFSKSILEMQQYNNGLTKLKILFKLIFSVFFMFLLLIYLLTLLIAFYFSIKYKMLFSLIFIFFLGGLLILIDISNINLMKINLIVLIILANVISLLDFKLLDLYIKNNLLKRESILLKDIPLKKSERIYNRYFLIENATFIGETARKILIKFNKNYYIINRNYIVLEKFKKTKK